MKLLLINSIGRNKWGGGEKWMLMAAKSLSDRGHDVTIVCSHQSILESKAKAEGIQVKPIDIHFDFSPAAILKLKKLFNKEATDVVIACQNRDVRVAGIAALAAKKRPSIISRQGVQLVRNNLKYRLTYAPFCDGILTNTLSIKREYDSYGWWPNDFVRVIYNGVEPADESKAFDYSPYLPSHLENPTVVLSTGRLTRQKGFKYLIKAAQKVIKQHPNTFFFIAGKGKLKKDLEQQLSKAKLNDHVILLGFQQNIPALLKGANVFVLPSLYEGMPNSVMEAMAHSLPIISTDVNGVSELMVNGTHGRIVEAANADLLADALCSMLKHNSIQEMGTAGKEHVQQHFTIEKMTDALEAYLLEKMPSK